MNEDKLLNTKASLEKFVLGRFVFLQKFAESPKITMCPTSPTPIAC